MKVLSPGLGYSHIRSLKCVKSTSVTLSHEQGPLPSVRSVLLFLSQRWHLRNAKLLERSRPGKGGWGRDMSCPFSGLQKTRVKIVSR